jgi:hypothetical protein
VPAGPESAASPTSKLTSHRKASLVRAKQQGWSRWSALTRVRISGDTPDEASTSFGRVCRALPVSR